jgi:DNA end-binding protein Ku
VLLLEAMKQAGMGGIGRFVLRGAEYFCLIRPKGEALVLETLFLAEDIRSQAEIEEAVAGTEVKAAELKLAQQVMDSLVGEFDPSELESQYRHDLRKMLEAKLDGQEIAKPEPAPEAPVVDLMEALKKSVAEAKDRKTAAASKPKAAAKSGSRGRRTPARKSA